MYVFVKYCEISRCTCCVGRTDWLSFMGLPKFVYNTIVECISLRNIVKYVFVNYCKICLHKTFCKLFCEMFVKYCEFLILTNVLNQGPWISAVVALMLVIASLS